MDNYAGVKGVGPVKAKKILDGAKTEVELWERTRTAFVKAGYTEEDCLTQVRLARILRDGDYDNQLNAVNLWRPECQRNVA